MKQPINKAINEIRLNKVRRDLRRINQLAPIYRAMDDDKLKQQTSLLKSKVKNGAELNTILAEAYAVIREAALRVLNMYPKDVQVMGAIVMHQGHIAEMQTGEGKTLTATMPLYLNALAGRGVFLITTNDYLAKRDLEEMKPLYEWLGLTAELGFVDEEGHKYKSSEKQQIYLADIIYTTNGRLGFDYLINHLADNKPGQFLAPLRFAIIDEIDSVILDSAQTPLVISGTPRVQSNLFYIVKEFVDTLTTQDFELKESQKEIFLTETGIDKACHYFNIDDLYQQQYAPLIRNINLALRAQYLFESNVDYFIYHGEIVLIDRISGRLLHGTKLQSGLHQAIEAKEQLPISNDMSVMATITFQNLFKQFHRFSGMTATGQLGEREFFDIYAKVVVTIPTDQPLRRLDLPDRVFINEHDKNRAVIEEVTQLYHQKRPVLLITRTMEAAEYYSDVLYQRDIPNNLLIAQNVAKEAQMIKEAGQLGAVTVATSMAGRGTDIKITDEVQKLGGLAVIINEHMDNSRLDKQLRGRSGRQGDIGSSQIFISLDDYLLAKWSSHPLVKNKAVRLKDASAFEQSYFFSRRVKKMVAKAQKVAEEEGVTTREMANEFEKSISIQREMIYQERSHILNHSDLTSFNFMLLAEDVIDDFIRSQEKLTAEEVLSFIYQHISFQFEGDIQTLQENDKFAVGQFLKEHFRHALDAKLNVIGKDHVKEYLQKAMLKGIDSGWINQVDNLQQLKGSVNNRQNGQRSPIFEYHRAALDSYQYMTRQIKRNMIRNICLSMTTFDKNGQLIVHFP